MTSMYIRSYEDEDDIDVFKNHVRWKVIYDHVKSKVALVYLGSCELECNIFRIM